MMRKLLLVLLFASVVVGREARSVEPRDFVDKPENAEGWLEIDYPNFDSHTQWHVGVFVDTATGDLLSIASRYKQPEEPGKIDYWGDTAREIFPIGHPFWVTSPRTKVTSSTISSSVGTYSLRGNKSQSNDAQAVLSYVLITSPEFGEKRMVQGHAFTHDEIVIIVQHTSISPIENDVAWSAAKSCLLKFVTVHDPD